MPDTQILFTSAARLAGAIQRKALSPVEVMQAVLKAAEAAQPTLNAFVTITADQALADAKRAEAQVMQGAPLGPLHGVPVTIKDLIDVAGVPTRHGSAIFADNPPAAEDDILVQRLRAAGAIVFAKTTTPEFGVKGMTDGPSFGTTRNPWNLGRTPGGSSGGAAAAVAAGIGPLGLGTDGAGSVRGPAACCGVVGLKPTLGAVPQQGYRDAFGSNVFAGPLTRSVTDCAMMHAAMTGPSAKDPWSIAGEDRRTLSPALTGGDLGAIRIGYIPRCGNARVDPDVAANTRASLQALEAMGGAIDEVTGPIDWIEYEGRILYQGNFTTFCEPYLPRWQNQMDPVTVAFVQRGAAFSMVDFRNAQYARTRLFRTIQGLFDRYDVLVMPTLTRTALPVGFDVANHEVEVDGERCGTTRQGWTSYLYPFNLTGHPALSVPSGFAADGLPTATQIVGRWGEDTNVLRLGALLEQALPWADKRPAFT